MLRNHHLVRYSHEFTLTAIVITNFDGSIECGTKILTKNGKKRSQLTLAIPNVTLKSRLDPIRI
jgi:hypothetical protein